MALKRARRVKGKSRVPRTKKNITWTAIRKANKKRQPSSLELIVYGWLNEDGVDYKKEKAIGRCHVDIFLEETQTVVELQGCFWHACPICFPAKTKKAISTRAKDIRRLSFLRSKGFEVITIWEHDVLNFPTETRERIKLLAC